MRSVDKYKEQGVFKVNEKGKDKGTGRLISQFIFVTKISSLRFFSLQKQNQKNGTCTIYFSASFFTNLNY